jgi:hypothetical protein
MSDNNNATIGYLAMRAGDYYVGDLCYVMHDEWKEVCELLFEGRTDHGCNEGIFNLKDGRTFALFNTAWGDGVYEDNFGAAYMVDAGCIGCIKLSDIDLDNPDNGLTGGQIVGFDNDFEVDSDGALLTFGHIRIDTDPYYEDDSDEFTGY